MAGDTIWPGGFDTAYGTEAEYRAGFRNNIDGAGDDEATWMWRQESGILAMQTWSTRNLGKAGSVSISNSSAANSLLSSTITVPANLLRAGSTVEFQSRGVATLNSGTPTLTLAFKLGSTTWTFAPTTGLTANASPHQYIIRGQFCANSIGSTGDIHLIGEFRVTAPTTSAGDVNSVSVFGGAAASVDTTADQAFDLQLTMSVANAANSVVSGVTTLTHIPFIG